MATRTYTRPADPINTDDLAVTLSTALSKTVTVAVDLGNAYVTGTITSGDDTAIQNAITAYTYVGHAGDAGGLVIDDGAMATASRQKASSQRAAYIVDVALQANIDKKTAVRFWDAGTFQNGSPDTGDVIVMTDTTTIAASGNAVFNLTGDHTSSGTALCSSILANSCVANFVDNTGVFSQGVPSVAGNLKTVTIATTKQAQSGVVLLSTTIVGSVTQPASPNGTTVRFFGIGVSI